MYFYVNIFLPHNLNIRHQTFRDQSISVIPLIPGERKAQWVRNTWRRKTWPRSLGEY